jgi:hypothetical protein
MAVTPPTVAVPSAFSRPHDSLERSWSAIALALTEIPIASSALPHAMVSWALALADGTEGVLE